MTFFSRRGFGYGALPQPHLKVDEHTSPDQCLRIYWDVDSQTRLVGGQSPVSACTSRQAVDQESGLGWKLGCKTPFKQVVRRTLELTGG